MKRVLVTGGCGFLGSNVASHFLGEGWRVIVLDALMRRGAEANLAWLRSRARDGQFTCVHHDLADEVAVGITFKEHGPFDFVCHLGGQVAMTSSLSDPRRDFLTNVVGTFNILEAVRQWSGDALVAYSSTNKVYGDLDSIRCTENATRYVAPDFPNGFDESTPLDFASPYGCSKGAADQYVRDWHRNYGLRTVVFRHSSIYGDRQYATIDQGWIGWFCSSTVGQQRAVRAGGRPEPFTISGSGKQVRDVLHGEDLVRLYAASFENRDRVAGEIFNIGGGMENSLSLLELFELLRGLTGVSPAFNTTSRRLSDQKIFVADIRKVERLLDWRPRIRKEEGIARMIQWVSNAPA